MCTAAILAGGHARRFGGRPKPFLPIGDQRLIDRQIDVLCSVARHVVIVANECDLYGGIGVPIWQDLVSGTGPLGIILTAFVNGTTSSTLVIADDMPFLYGAVPAAPRPCLARRRRDDPKNSRSLAPSLCFVQGYMYSGDQTPDQNRRSEGNKYVV